MEEGGDDGSEASFEGNEIDKCVSNENSNLFPPRKWSTLWLHASIMGGREFLYAVEIVLVTPIILQLGMPERFYSFMWCFSPILGVIVGPVLGSSSDRCKSRFGRRRPYIVGLVIGAIIGLTLLIFSKDLALLIGGASTDDQRLWGIVVGVMGAQLMDFCLDQTETPLRAYTLDVCSQKDQQRAFALQTVFIGIGGALGFIVDGIDWESTALASLIDSQIQVVYVFAVFAYVISTLLSLFSIREVPLHRNSSTTSCNATIPKLVVTQLPLLRKSKSFQVTSRSDGSTQTTLDDTKHDRVPKPFQNGSTSPDVLVSLLGEDYNRQGGEAADFPSQYTRAISSHLHHPVNKNLYISASCPGGLEENQANDESSCPVPSSGDSAYTEDANSMNISSLEEGTTSVSLPSLESKKADSVSRGRSLLELIRAKEFSIRNLRTSNKVVHNDMQSNCKDSKIIRNLNTEKCDDQFIENGLLPSNNHTIATYKCPNDSNKDTLVGKSVATLMDNRTDQNKLTNGKTNGELKNRKKKKNQDGAAPVTLKQLWLSIATMPYQLKWLCLAQLLGFIGCETVMLWYTDLMGRVVYEGDPQGASNSTSLARYNAGVKMGCWGLAIYSVAMIMFSVFMERCRILKRFSIRLLYSFSFLLMAIVMLIMYVFVDRYVILLLSWTIGISIAVLLTVPYVLVGKYHLSKKYVMKSPGKTKRGFGLDCSILACQMYAGNVISASVSSPVIYLAGSCKAMLLLTGACNFLAFFFAYLFVSYPGEGRSRFEPIDLIEKSTETT